MDPTPPTSQTFLYRAATASGAPVSGTLEAESLEAARQLLSDMGLAINELEIQTEPSSRREALGSRDLVAFNQQLAHLTAAGLPVESGLRLIAQETNSRRMAAAIRDLAEKIERGASLGEAFQSHRGQFPPLYGQLIDAGIASRNLPAMLFNLGRHMELIHRLRAAIWHAAAYPMLVIAGIFAVLLFLQLFILPEFQEIFDDFDTELPWLTETLIRTAQWMPHVLIGLMALIILFPFLWRMIRA